VFGAGAILVAVSPGAGMSNILAALAGANTALSVTLTAVTSVMSVLTLPVITSIAMRVFLAQEGDVDVPVLGLVAQLTASLLVPISIGMWIRTRRPETAARIAPRLHRITMVTIAVMVVLAVVLSDPGEIDFEGSGNALLAAAVWTAAAMATGWGIAAGLRLPNRDRFTFLIEFSTRNVAIATIVAMSGLDRIDLTLFSGLYFVTGYPMAVGAVLWRRRQYGLQGFRRRAPDETP
jgi:BASS family bile acid:Na+ symporter